MKPHDDSLESVTLRAKCDKQGQKVGTLDPDEGLKRRMIAQLTKVAFESSNDSARVAAVREISKLKEWSTPERDTLTRREMDHAVATLSRIITEEVEDPDTVKRIGQRFAQAFAFQESDTEGRTGT